MVPIYFWKIPFLKGKGELPTNLNNVGGSFRAGAVAEMSDKPKKNYSGHFLNDRHFPVSPGERILIVWAPSAGLKNNNG